MVVREGVLLTCVLLSFLFRFDWYNWVEMAEQLGNFIDKAYKMKSLFNSQPVI